MSYEWDEIDLADWNPADHPRGPLGKFVEKGFQPNLGGAPQAKAALEDPDIGGFTYDPREGRVLDIGDEQGFAIAVPGTEHSLGNGNISQEDFAANFESVANRYRDHLSAGSYLGGWYSDDRDEFMTELTNIHRTSREEAIRRGARDNQEGVFDVGEGEFIPTGGSGDG